MWIFRIKSSLKQNINLGKKEFVKTIMIPLIFLDTQISSYFIENLHQQRKEIEINPGWRPSSDQYQVT